MDYQTIDMDKILNTDLLIITNTNHLIHRKYTRF